MMKRFISYNRSVFFLAVLFSAIIYPAINLLLAFVLKMLIDAGMMGNVTDLKRAIVYCLIVCLTLAISLYLSDITKNKFIKSISLLYRQDIFKRLINSNLTDFRSSKSGKYISMLTTNVKSVEDNFIGSYFNVLSNLFLLVFSLVGMFVIDWRLSVGVLFISILPMLVMGFTGRHMKNTQQKAFLDESKYTSKVKDALSGFLVIKSFNIEKEIGNEFTDVNRERSNSSYAMNSINGLTISISSLAGYLVFLVAYGLGMIMVINGEVSIGGVTAIVQLVNFVVMPLNKLGLEMNKMKSGESAVQDIEKSLSKAKQNVLDQPENQISDFNNTIDFKNVSFSYPGSDEHANKAIKNLNLRLEKGKKYAVVGMSGSGKSTLFRLLLRYYNLPKGNGTIEIDGLNLNNISLDSIYKLINIVQQDVYMFDSSLRDNITLGKDFQDQEVMNVIKEAGLDSLVTANSSGIDMHLGEEGKLVSGGEKQRISIARALIRKTPILLMDEATASLDQKNTFEIENSLLNIKGLTAVIITHKLNPQLLSKYDSILFMKDGEVTEFGSFDNLMEIKGDFFKLCTLTLNE
ncbi:ABC transporter ATP-binding protein [Bacillus subtilis]|uniref:ABC transporter ATP-binding protein n=2 Tax=Bacillus subtilis TaxID=1423 RepID=UPI00209A9AAD|nr:ABC transporter ATP-binding protein [Bacillus subtilis]MDQ4712318.1 ABC transporter ATP-binding protein [Bacillus subtilis]